MISDKIKEFGEVRQELIEKIACFPPDQRTQTLFDKWSLKDVLAHLNHWIEHDINCLEALKRGEEPIWEPDVDIFNAQGVDKRKSQTWEEVYKEFEGQGEKLLGLYQSLPDGLWNKEFWQNREETPATFLKENIDHWRGEHLPQLAS